MRCALCDSPAWHGFEHDRENWRTREWRPAMLMAHYEQILRMRPLPSPDSDNWTDENLRGWEGPPASQAQLAATFAAIDAETSPAERETA